MAKPNHIGIHQYQVFSITSLLTFISTKRHQICFIFVHSCPPINQIPKYFHKSAVPFPYSSKSANLALIFISKERERFGGVKPGNLGLGGFEKNWKSCS
ncbi:unnamed protein product [Lactuca virosa]|uniref:Uncharacterized protein n=1 Tax=Lactuca virosa TaxID=75947 RepID=A0AAU9NV04_9ASTR|nr:unnamed protein product [Lactuca virosa]